MPTLAEKIVAAEAELVTLKDGLVSATDALEGAPDEESLLAQVEELTDQVEKKTAHVAALKKAESALASRAQRTDPVNAPAVIPHLRQLRDPKKGGEIMWKHATAKLLAYVEKKPVEQIIAERYDDDERVKATYEHNMILKTAVNPAMTTVPAWAGALVREDTRGFMEALTEVSVAAALASRVNALDFAGANSIKIPYENPLAATPTEPAWVGEGGVIPLTSFSFGSLTLNPYKLAAITTMTREIVDRSTPAIEGIVQNLLRKAYAKVVDQALLALVAPAVVNVRPASLYHGVAATTAGAGTGDENVRADVLALLSKLAAAGLGANPVLIGNKLDFLSAGMMVNAMGEFLFKSDVASNNLMGIPIIGSGHVPLHQLGIVDADYVAMALGAIEFDVSDVATVTEANADATPPTQSVDFTGALATAGQVGVNAGIKVGPQAGAGAAGVTTRSLWQTYSLGIRMVAETSWGKLNPAAAQYIAATDWA